MRLPAIIALLLLVGAAGAADAKDQPDPAAEYAERVKQTADTPEAQLALAQWCQRKDLEAEMARHAEAVIAKQADNYQARRLLGYEKHNGKWLRGEELYQAKGWQEYHGRWLPKSEIRRIEMRKARFRELSKQRSDWENAWELKTPNFKIRSNCPPAVVQEMAEAMEKCHAQLAKIFRPKKTQQIPLEIYATQEQFMKGSAKAGIFIPPGVLGYFYYGPSTGIRCFYAGSMDRTLGTLFHECTHLMIRSAYNEPAIWANEGMAVFFEYARVTDAGLDIRSIPWNRLWSLRDQMKEEDINLDKLVQLEQSEYNGMMYPRGWGLIHYLLYGANGKYLPSLQKYYEQRTRKDTLTDFRTAFGVRPSDFAKDWEAYIAKLEPQTVDDLMAAALTAIESRGDGTLARDYATQARTKGASDWRTAANEGRVLLRIAQLENDREVAAQAAEAFAAGLQKRPKAKKASLRELRLDYERGLAHLAAGDAAAAVAAAEDILERDEVNADAYRLLALAALTGSDKTTAIADAKESMDIADDLGPSHENMWARARIAIAEGKKEAATKLLHEASELDMFGYGGRFYRREAARLNPQSMTLIGPGGRRVTVTVSGD